jgi:hypothetical protein
MTDLWKTYVPFPPQTELMITGKADGTVKILESKGNFLKLFVKMEKWSWGSAPVKAFEGEVEITFLNEKKLKAKSTNQLTRKTFEVESIDVVLRGDRFQISSSGFLGAAGEIVLASPELITIELKVGGALALICRGPALFQLKKKS